MRRPRPEAEARRRKAEAGRPKPKAEARSLPPASCPPAPFFPICYFIGEQ
jgi:hypothetical protein